MSWKKNITQFKNIPTPFYFYDLELLRATLQNVKDESGKYGYDVHYAFKANTNNEILNLIREFGLGADCVSGNEIRKARELNFSSDKALEEFLLFRFSNDLNWFLSEKLVQATHVPSLIQSINKYNSVSYNFRLTFGNEKNKLQHLSTVYSINYRHGTPSQRIFIDLIPTYAYPKDDYFTEVKSFEVRFEYFFGDLK